MNTDLSQATTLNVHKKPGQQSNLSTRVQDIEAVDPDFYKNLAWMLENDIADVLDLTFTEETDYFGRKQLVELKPEGASLRVTDANKREYVNLVAQHRMTKVISGQINAFLGGFWDLVPKVGQP